MSGTPYNLGLKANKGLSVGKNRPLGAAVESDGVNFAVYSRHAEQVFLLLFDNDKGPATDIIKLENKTDNIWHVFVQGIGAGQFYGYKVFGEYNPASGKRFNPYKLLLDPYAKAVSSALNNNDSLIFPYDVNSEDKDLAMDKRDNSSVMPKSIVVKDDFDWGDDTPPNIPPDRLIIYEAHVKGFTVHPSSKVKYPGTYLGFIEKIPHLKRLGVSAVEFMPLQGFYTRVDLLDKGLSEFWGYNTICFFAPEPAYSSQNFPGCGVNEFKTLVKELHKSGIEVIMDVVYNHTGEGNESGPSLCFKGIDNPTYYSLVPGENEDEPSRCYLNDSGCGNTLNAEEPIVRNFIFDSLRYWADVMRVDGFRFDLATLLTRVNGKFDYNSVFFDAVSRDPVLKKVKLIAEPWDLTAYQPGGFREGWYEWNGKFRDTVRKAVKGDKGQIKDLAYRVTGSEDLFGHNGRKPYHSVNFITAHDGFTLKDLFSYNNKRNGANFEDNKDGANDNNSWNCGFEGETESFEVNDLRKRMMKNAVCFLLFSAGTPMILYGDELARSQKGNNNAYCQDNELTWINWDYDKNSREIFEFYKKAVDFRMRHDVLRKQTFFRDVSADPKEIPEIIWFNKKLSFPQWDNFSERTLCYQLNDKTSGHLIFFVLNFYYRGIAVFLPQYERLRWYRVIDTSHKSGDDFLPRGKERRLKSFKHHCNPRSIAVFIGK